MIDFILNNQNVTASHDETLWQVAKRHGETLPHFCFNDRLDYEAKGNCRACVVEIEGERTLAPSCCRYPTQGMNVQTQSPRAVTSREQVAAMLQATPEPIFDTSHPAILVNHAACIACGLCVQACRDVQHNDVIGLSFRGSEVKITFDLGDDMGASTCVACGECVEVCPTKALLPATLPLEADKTIDTLCPYCGVGCQTKAFVKEDKIIKIEGRNGPANRNRLCVKGRFGFDYIHHEDRLTTPLMRVNNVLTPVSWETALARIAKEFAPLKPHEIAGFGSAKCSNEEAYLFQKLMRQGFRTNNVDHCTRLCHASSVAALMEGLNSAAVSAPFTDALYADCIIVIGARPSENHPVAATFIKEAASKGAKLYVLDPRGQSQGLSRYATRTLNFTPSSDVALLNAMIHVIITENLIDEGYINAHTLGFAEIITATRETTPEAMSPLCGIAPQIIREVARTYATAKASLIFWGMGVSQSIHGTDNARCLITLALITGQIGREGTGLHPLRGQNNVQGASDAGLIPFAFPDYQAVDNTQNQAIFQEAWGVTLPAQRGLTVVEIIDAVYEGQIKAMYIAGENPAMSDPDQAHVKAALTKLPFLVVQDIFLTETAQFADVVLPASAHAEKTGTYTNTNRQVQLARACVPSPGEAKSDYEITTLIANAMGLNWHYTHPREIFTEMAALMPSLQGITWERLEREEVATYPQDKAVIFDEGFPTQTGKAKLVATSVTPPNETIDKAFPFVLTTGRLLEHWHTGAMTRRANVLDALESEPHVSLHPLDAASYPARVKISTRRGHLTLKVRQDKDLPRGMAFIPFAFHEAAANLLTNPALDPFGKIPEFKYAAAKIEGV